MFLPDDAVRVAALSEYVRRRVSDPGQADIARDATQLAVAAERAQQRFARHPAPQAHHLNLVFRRLAMTYRFEDYSIQTGLLNSGEGYFAAIEEFAALVEAGASVDEAVQKLRGAFKQRLQYLKETGRDVPAPGSGKGKIELVPNDQIGALRPLVDLFWHDVLDQSYDHSYVSNESSLLDWEHCVPGGREEIISRALARFGVDISDCYDGTVVDVLRKLESPRVN